MQEGERECYTVFTGSRNGNSPAYANAARQVGEIFASSNVQLVYGGGANGLMGITANACANAGGDVHGVIPGAFLNTSIPFPESHERPLASLDARDDDDGTGVQKLESGGTMRETVVGSMHERKTLMAKLCQGFVALPGGYGSLEEVAEMTTWTQLGIHKKPVVLLNVQGFYEPLRLFVDNAIKAGFISEPNRAFMTFVDKPQDLTDDEFDWGQAALVALRDWTRQGAGGGTPYALQWT